MDETRTFECPSCGGELTTDGHIPTIECPYCGRTVSVPHELRAEPPPAVAPESALIPLIKLAEQEAEQERAEQARRATQPAPRRRRGCGCGSFIFAVVLILVVLVAGAVFSGNGPALLQVLDAASGATPTPKPVSHPLTASLPRSLRYAGALLTINSAELTNADPSASDRTRYRSDRLYAVLTGKLDNSSGDRDVSLPYNIVRLQLADGNQYDESGAFDFQVGGAATRSARLVFTVPTSATWQGAKLIVRASGKEPAVLPLDGAAPKAPLGPTDAKVTPEKAAGPLVYRVIRATLDTARDGQQVDAGKRFLRFNMRVVNNGTQAGGVDVTGSNFRLLVEGDSLAPDQSLIEAVAPQSKVDGLVDFTIPANAKTAILQVGALDGPKAQIQVNLAP